MCIEGESSKVLYLWGTLCQLSESTHGCSMTNFEGFLCQIFKSTWKIGGGKALAKFWIFVHDQG